MVAEEPDEAGVERLLEQVLESGESPDRVCAARPELLPDVWTALRELRELQDEVAALFPPSTEEMAATPVPPTQNLPAVPGYEVLGVLGHGGMGVVFRARHVRLNRVVALKMIPAGEYASASQRERFLREAEAVAALDHPNVVQVYDAGEAAGRPWFTMELVEGGSLAGRIDGAPRPVRRSAALLRGIARGVAVAHRRGIVHRDLKPSNILLAGDGTPKVADFGLARWLDQPGATLTGGPVGTAGYMAPEQTGGDPHEVGPAADVFSLGAILYELLTGRPAYRAETAAATLRQMLTQPVAPPRRLNPRVPRDLETICLKCLEKDPGRRFPTATELADDLDRYLKHEPIVSRPVGRVGRCVRLVRRQPGASTGAVGAVIIAVVLAIGGLHLHAQHRAGLRAARADLDEAGRLARASAWTDADVVLDRAAALIANGGPEDLRRRLGEERAAVERGRRRFELVRRVEEVRLTRLTRVEGRFDPRAESLFRNEKADGEYARAFAAAGLNLDRDAADNELTLTAADAVREVAVSLDDWRLCCPDRRRRDRLAEVLRRLDPDPWRDTVRDPSTWEDDAAVLRAARSARVAEQPTDFLTVLAERTGPGSGDGADLLKRLAEARPADFWANFALGNMLLPHDPKTATAYYRRAAGLRPDSVAALNNLGVAQYAMFLLEDATNSFHESLRVRVTAAALNNLGLRWKAGGNYPEAEDHFRDAVRADPELPEPRCNLADVSATSGGEGVVEHLRHAVAIDPKFAHAHYLLGIALCARSPIDEANAIRSARSPGAWGAVITWPISYYHAALGFDPAWTPVTQDRARLDDAIAEYRSALACDPSLARAHAALGQALLHRGQYEAALQATRRAIALADQEHPHEEPMGQQDRINLAGQRRRCERGIEWEARLASAPPGGLQPAGADEALELAEVCVETGRPAAAAGFFLRAFEAEPRLTEDPETGYGYRAACAAALAGANTRDAGAARWRGQSRRWLRAELERSARRGQSADPAEAARAYFELSHWLSDPALASVRDEDLLARVPRDEADECRRLWADVRATRGKAEEQVNTTLSRSSEVILNVAILVSRIGDPTWFVRSRSVAPSTARRPINSAGQNPSGREA